LLNRSYVRVGTDSISVKNGQAPLKKIHKFNHKESLNHLMMPITKIETGGMLWKIPLRTIGKPD
jgi:hypothetical protein